MVVKPVCTMDGAAVPLTLLIAKLVKFVAVWHCVHTVVPIGM